MTKEGGLGIWGLNEIQKSLHMKYAWRLMAIDNLWARFFQAEYVKHGHISLANKNQPCSWFWKSILKVFPLLWDNVTWKIKVGNVSFWHDNWLLEGPLNTLVMEVANRHLRVRDCWLENLWNEDLLEKMVGQETMESNSKEIKVGGEGPNILIWKQANA